MHLICHVTSFDQVLKGLRDFMGGKSSRQATTFARLVAINLVQVGFVVFDLSRELTRRRD